MSNQQEWNSAAMEHYKPAKPEGPAQQRCGMCDWPIVDNGTRVEHIGFDHPAVPATPAPSQPAITNRFCTRCGKLNDGHQHEPPTRDRHDRPAFTGCCGTPTTGLSYVNPQHRADCPLRNAPSQPAAREEAEIGLCFDVIFGYVPEARDEHGKSLSLSDKIEILGKQLEAAVRERDSLREANARLAADLDAALKAAKDGQK